jgi:hypothetical protein
MDAAMALRRASLISSMLIASNGIVLGPVDLVSHCKVK